MLQHRRQRLSERVDFPVILWSGQAAARNFPANRYRFRASSHFLYFAGVSLENAAIRLADGQLELFCDDRTPEATLWHGPEPSRDDIARDIDASAAYPLAELSRYTADAATLPAPDPLTRQHQTQLLGRDVPLLPFPSGKDLDLAEAIVSLRLSHDAEAIAEIRQAAAVSIDAHRAGMAAVRQANTEADVRAAIERTILARDRQCAYNSIVTVAGEVLHNESYHRPVRAGDLLLADVGAESPHGWASDITRTYPVSGNFSPTQRDIYDIVLAAHDACIDAVRPGVEYRDLHFLAAQTIAAGLVDLGLLRGQPEDLVAADAHALFFPHGVGHLLGLDVHDMEDLGDLAGYAPGRTRSDRFGLANLRLDRPLNPGAIVTIEPGFYQVPAILGDRQRLANYKEMLQLDRLEPFADVRGIRIEDDVLVTETGHEVLTADLPTSASAIEQAVRG